MATVALPSSAAETRRPYDLRQRHEVDAGPLMMFLLSAFWLFFFFGQKFESLPIRGEDVVFCLLFLFSLRYLTMRKSILFGLIMVYFLINPAVYLVYYLNGRYELSHYPVIVFKEMEYFYVAFLMYCHGMERRYYLVKLLDALVFINLCYGIAGCVFGWTVFYGIGSMSSDGAALSGGLFMLSTVWLDIRASQRNLLFPQWVYSVFLPVGIVCTLATVSRSSILALAGYFLSRLVLSRNRLSIAAKLTCLAALLACSLACLGQGTFDVIDTIEDRFAKTGDAGAYRMEKWTAYLSELEPAEWCFGRGKGFGNVVTGERMVLAVDSQYTRILLENGVFGMVLLFWLIAAFLYRTYRKGSQFGHAASLCLAMAIMCIPLEVLQVSKTGQMFWMILFVLLPDKNVIRLRPLSDSAGNSEEAATVSHEDEGDRWPRSPGVRAGTLLKPRHASHHAATFKRNASSP